MIVELDNGQWALDVVVDGEPTTIILAFSPNGHSLDIDAYPAQLASLMLAAERRGVSVQQVLKGVVAQAFAELGARS